LREFPGRITLRKAGGSGGAQKFLAKNTGRKIRGGGGTMALRTIYSNIRRVIRSGTICIEGGLHFDFTYLRWPLTLKGGLPG